MSWLATAVIVTTAGTAYSMNRSYEANNTAERERKKQNALQVKSEQELKDRVKNEEALAASRVKKQRTAVTPLAPRQNFSTALGVPQTATKTSKTLLGV